MAIPGIVKKRWFIVIVVLLLLGVGLFWRSRQMNGKIVTYVKAQKEDIEQTIDVPGVIDAKVKANLKFLVGGKLVSISVEEGQTIKKGQRIASIDARDLQKNLSKSLNDYLSERLDFEQGKENRQDSAPTNSLSRTAQKEQVALQNTVSDVELRDLALKNATLYSPIAGVVTSLPVDTPGVQVIATDTFEIVDPSSLVFEAEVDEVDIGSIPTGTSVRFVLDAYPDEKIDGSIGWIGLKAKSSSKSSGGTVFPVRVVVPSTDLSKFRLGMNGTMTIILKQKSDVLTIPIEATTVRDGKTYVSVKNPQNEKKPIEKEISVGIENEDKVEVVSGLTIDDEVLISN